MATVLPVSLMAEDIAGAMLRSNGVGVFVNGSPVPASNALFPNDLIETQKGSIARIEATGSSADIVPETVVQFGSEELVLDHGGLSVFTTRGLRVRVGCVTITPVNPSIETAYEVIDREGKVSVHAGKSDVYIDAQSKDLKEIKQPSESKRDVVREGEQKSREEKCGAAPAARLPGIGAMMNSTTAKIVAGVAAGGIICLILCRNEPISPSKP